MDLSLSYYDAFNGDAVQRVVFSLAPSALVLLIACTSNKRPDAFDVASSASPDASNTPVELEIQLRLKQAGKQVRADAPIPLEFSLVNRSETTRYWLGRGASPPVASCTAQQQDADGHWVNVSRTPVDRLCGADPLEWSAPSEPIEPGEIWVLQPEVSATTARCTGKEKFIGFQFCALAAHASSGSTTSRDEARGIRLRMHRDCGPLNWYRRLLRLAYSHKLRPFGLRAYYEGVRRSQGEKALC